MGWLWVTFLYMSISLFCCSRLVPSMPLTSLGLSSLILRLSGLHCRLWPMIRVVQVYCQARFWSMIRVVGVYSQAWLWSVIRVIWAYHLSLLWWTVKVFILVCCLVRKNFYFLPKLSTLDMLVNSLPQMSFVWGWEYTRFFLMFFLLLVLHLSYCPELWFWIQTLSLYGLLL